MRLLGKKEVVQLRKNIKRSILHKGKLLLLAYDQGIEHGPADFNLENISPEKIIAIAEKGKYTGIILHHGVAEKYYDPKKCKVPLVIKLNGKTNIAKKEPLSLQVCSVKRAVSLGASALGYTIYPGSENEHLMFSELGRIVEEARSSAIPVIVWAYPRGKHIRDQNSTETVAYAARVALELGADIVKVNYNGDPEGLKWVVKSAGKARIIAAGGSKLSDSELLANVHEIMNAGGCGLAIGRNVWQHPDPLKISKALAEIVFNSAAPEKAARHLQP